MNPQLTTRGQLLEPDRPAAKRGDVPSVNATLRIMDRRAKLNGLDRPTVLHVEGSGAGMDQPRHVPTLRELLPPELAGGCTVGTSAGPVTAPGTASGNTGADHDPRLPSDAPRLGSVSERHAAEERAGAHVVESHCAVVTTTDSAKAAEDLGREIVKARLGACVQIVGPIRSIYRWEGGVENDQEWQCWVKTSADRLDALTEHIKKNHSYDVPEVVALPIVGGSVDYLSWVTSETRPA